MDLGPTMGSNCFGDFLRLMGHSLLPDPPANITIFILAYLTDSSFGLSSQDAHSIELAVAGDKLAIVYRLRFSRQNVLHPSDLANHAFQLH